MNHVRVEDVPWIDFGSPSGKFAGAGRQLSEALGAVAGADLANGGHPFDLELGRLPPRKTACPFHSHSSQWELFIILSGSGVVRHGPDSQVVRAGDAILHPPGSPHQLINTGDEELTYYLVADNPKNEYVHYPDSDKWGLSPGGGIFRRNLVPYWQGEDDGATHSAAASPPPAPHAPAPASRFVALETIPWEQRRSPRGRFNSYCRDISIALGAERNRPPSHGGHPFDVQIRRVQPGAAICPFHLHVAQWELFVFTRGEGWVRSGDQRQAVRAGDVVLHPPGTPHQTGAAAGGELECLIVADNPPVDIFHYPESNKWGMRPPGKFFRLTEVDYFDGED